MKSKSELIINKKTLQIDALMSVGDPERLKKLRRQLSLLYHPDRHPITEQEIYAPIFQNMSQFIDTLENPEALTEMVEHELTHTYSASDGSNSRITGKTEYHFLCPEITSNKTFNAAVKEIYELTNDDMEKINQSFNAHLASFIEKIPAIKKPSLFDDVFGRHQNMESDLLFLINHLQRDELIKNISSLQSSQPKYQDFIKNRAEHSSLVLAFTNEYLNKKEFKANLYKIFLNLAYQQKEEPVHWLFKKKNYAYLAGIALKIPVFLISLMAACAAFIYSMSGLFSIPLILITLSFPLIAVIASLYTLAWAGSLTAYLLSDMDSIFDHINNAASVVATAIDHVVATTFNVEFHGTELAEVLAEVNHQSVTKHNVSNQSQSTFFKPYKSHNQNDYDTNPHEEIRLIENVI